MQTQCLRAAPQPLLEPEQEQQLARRWHQSGDRAATDLLVTSHLRLAAKIARRYAGYGLPIADLIAEANVGLVMAASRFEPDHGARFATYATWWIKSAIHEYVLRSWSLVRIGTTAAQKKLFFRLRGEIGRLGPQSGVLTSDGAEVIAERLGVAPSDVLEMDRRLRGDVSLNAPVRDDEDTLEWQDRLVDESLGAETMLMENDDAARQVAALRAALDVLTERERRIFEQRRLREKPAMLEELAQEFHISRERVRQIESRAFSKVSRAVRATEVHQFLAVQTR
jgi:RNA polymerase sigma-32 factor